MRLLPFALLLLLLTAAAGCGSSEAPAPREAASRFLRARDPIAQRYLVLLRDGPISTPELEAEARDLALGHDGAVLQTWKHAVSGFTASMREEDARALSEDPRVEWVEEDGWVKVDGTELLPPWNLDRIDQCTLPLDHRYTYPSGGAGVTAYVIDTGIRASHVELGGRVAQGFTTVGDEVGTGDCNGHGTHVAGILGGSTYGVAKDVRLVPVRVLDCSGSGPVSDVVSGIDWVTANHVSPAVANISLGTDGSATFDAAVQRAIAAGITFTVAAGNGAVDACTRSPARVPGALTVGATDASDAQASFSNWGACVDVYAPGVNVTSAWFTSDVATSTMNGTSMAAPTVGGVAALWLSAHPEATPTEVATAIADGANRGVTGLGSGSPDRLLFSGFVVGADVAPATEVGPLCTSTQDALANGGFEDRSSTAWTGSPGVVDDSAFPSPRTGRWKGWLAGYGSPHEDELGQTLILPPDACAVHATYWLRVTTEEPSGAGHDVLTVGIVDPLTGEEAVLATFSDRDAGDWTRHDLDLGAYRGRTVRLRFHATEDGQRQTSFLLDDVSVTSSQP